MRHGLGADSGLSPAELLVQRPTPLVIGHRGYSAFAPENTLPSFSLALDAGVDLVELDYHTSKDGMPIVIHDSELDRTTDACKRWSGKKLRVDSYTTAELQTLDAGEWFAVKHAGTRLPLLTEALDFIQGNKGMTLVEQKGGKASDCARILRERGLVNCLVVQSFDWGFIGDLHRLVPAQVLGALGPPGTRNGRKLEETEKALGPEWIAEAEAAGAKVIGWNKLVSASAVEEVHRRNLRLWVYTVNKEADVVRFLSLGVDGIISDNPSIVWRAMALRRPVRSAAKPRCKRLVHGAGSERCQTSNTRRS